MTLYSPFFMLGFLPLSAGIYNFLPQKLKTCALCIINLVFYLLCAGKYFIVLPALAIVAYALSFLGKKGFYICLILLPVIRIIGINAIGVSFFLLRAASYIYDGYTEKNILKVFAFLMFFPCIHAGPLARYGDIQKGFDKERDYSAISRGICLLILGALKKLFFADALYTAFDTFYIASTSLSAFAALSCYTLYIYFDFSGCSDMAIGIALMFGFNMPKNFEFPYMSRSVGEFFRRWHISLGRWLFDYVYIPLGGSKNGRVRTVISLFTVWLVSALWHGTSLSYLLWGAWFFLLSVLEKFGVKLGRLCTLFAVVFGWVFFFSKTPMDAFVFFKRLFALGDTLLYSRADIYNTVRYAPFAVFSAICATPLLHNLLCSIYKRVKPLAYMLVFPALLLVLSCLAVGGHMPFLYASF